MPIFDGTNEIEVVYDGATELEAIYDGTNEVWSNNKVLLLGKAQSIDVRSRYPKYAQLNANNFFIVSGGNASGRGYYQTDIGQLGYVFCSFTKSYSNGVITQRLKAEGGGKYDGAFGPVYDGVGMAICTKPNKLITLGSNLNTTYNIKSLYPNDYQRFTDNNFLILMNSTGDVGVQTGRNEWFSGQSYIGKSYNASTGILSVSAYAYSQDSGSRTNYGGTVYLFKGTPKSI